MQKGTWDQNSYMHVPGRRSQGVTEFRSPESRDPQAVKPQPVRTNPAGRGVSPPCRMARDAVLGLGPPYLASSSSHAHRDHAAVLFCR